MAAVLSAASLAFLSACAANPGPPPVVEDNASALQEDQATTTAKQQEEPPQDTDSAKRPTISVGVDPLRAGLNPHLVANNSELVDQIAELVLPSTFHGGQRLSLIHI